MRTPYIVLLLLGSLLLLLAVGYWYYNSQQPRDLIAYKNTAPILGAQLGRPVFIRIIKESRQLELWVQAAEGTWSLMKTYPILAMSGHLGPKLREGDKQAPEGFYEVRANQLNPKSRFHLAMNIGYPNDYDRAQGRTGSFIMIHGSHYSVGCFAMGDDGIEEIYTMVAQALNQGQSAVPVQIYPFEMTDARLQQERNHTAYPFWQYLQQDGWQKSQQTQAPYVLD